MPRKSVAPLTFFSDARGVKETLLQMGYFYISYHMSVANAGYAGVAIFSRIRFTGFGDGMGDDELDSECRVAWVGFDKFRL